MMIDLAPPPLLIGFEKPAIVRANSLDLTPRQRFGRDKIVWPSFASVFPLTGNQGAFGAPLVLTFEDSSEVNGDVKEQTQSGISIGAEADDRIIVVGVVCKTTYAGQQSSFDRVQIDNVDMTIVENPTENHSITALAYLAVPTGTTATFKTRVSGTRANYHSIYVWSLTGAASSPFASVSAFNDTSSNSISAGPISIPSGGIALGVANKLNSGSFSWAFGSVVGTQLGYGNGGAFSEETLTGSQTQTATCATSNGFGSISWLTWGK